MRSIATALTGLAVLLVLLPGVAAGQCPEEALGEFEDLARVLFQDEYAKEYSSGVSVGQCTFGYSQTYDAAIQCDTGLEIHSGIDFRSQGRETVYSPVGGRVTRSCEPADPWNLGPVGIFVDDPDVTSTDPGDPDNVVTGYTVFFLHLSECFVRVGDEVKAGQSIGRSGERGAEGSPHLHVEVQPGEDDFPCGRRGGPEPQCPFNSGNAGDAGACRALTPTAADVIEAATYEPLSTIYSTVFVRDTQENLRAQRIQQAAGRVVIHGLLFGDQPGRVEVAVNLGDNARYMDCTGGDPMLRWEVVPEAADWTRAVIRTEIFPHRAEFCGEAIDFEAVNLDRPIFVRVENAEGRHTNYLPFPFKDIVFALPDDDGNLGAFDRGGNEWYIPHLMNVWSASIVNGFRRRENAEEGAAQVAINEYRPAAHLTRAELLKMAVLGDGLVVPDDPGCVCADVNDNHWVYRFLCAALDAGWVTCPFQPDATSVRSFTAQLLAAALDMPEGQEASDVYIDVPADHPAAREIAFATRRGVMTGDAPEEEGGQRTFRPDEELSRGEVVKVVDRAFLNPEEDQP